MKCSKIVWALLISLVAGSACAQSDAAQPKQRGFVAYAGIGPNYYFNNLVLTKNKVNELNYSVIGRFMWEPEHRLSLGIETGYVRLYTEKFSGSNGDVHIINGAIPILLTASMKVRKSFYVNFGMGRSFMLNRVTTSNYGNFNATILSLSDLSGTIGYKRQLNRRISLCTEAKFYYAAKADDKNIALVFLMGYSFK